MQLGMVKTEHWNIWNQIAGGKFMKHLHVCCIAHFSPLSSKSGVEKQISNRQTASPRLSENVGSPLGVR